MGIFDKAVRKVVNSAARNETLGDMVSRRIVQRAMTAILGEDAEVGLSDEMLEALDEIDPSGTCPGCGTPWSEHGDGDVIVRDIPDLVRDLLYDLGLTAPEEAMAALGYPRQSGEVSEMSRKESNERVMQIAPLIPMIDVMTGALAGTQVASVKGRLAQMISDEDELDELVDEMTERMQDEMSAVVVAVISSLNDMGLLTQGGVRLNGLTAYPQGEEDDDE